MAGITKLIMNQKFSYRVVNHLTGEVFECRAISRNRARRNAQRMAYHFLTSDGFRVSDFRKVFRGGELHLYKKEEQR